MPILHCLHFKTKENKLTIISTNLDTWVETETDLSNSNGNMEFLVDALALKTALKPYKKQEIQFEFNENKVFLSGVYGMTMVGADNAVEEMPVLPSKSELKSDGFLSINDLNLVAEAAKYVSTNETRYILTRVYVDNEKIVATNGKLLFVGRSNIQRVMKCQICQDVIDRLKNLVSFPNVLCYKYDEDTDLWVFDAIEHDGVKIYSVLANGKYPNYEQVIPDTQGMDTSWERCDTGLVDFLSTLKDEPVVISIVDDRVVFSSMPNSSKCYRYVSQEKINRAPLEYKKAYNAKFLVDGMKTCGIGATVYDHDSGPMMIKANNLLVLVVSLVIMCGEKEKKQ